MSEMITLPSGGAWEVVFTEQAYNWMLRLDRDGYRHITAAIEVLKDRGPALGRPLVDRIDGSRHHNMKELRASTIRALFAFDPDRRAVVLLAGDKRGDWAAWYSRNVPLADDLYDTYLREAT